MRANISRSILFGQQQGSCFASCESQRKVSVRFCFVALLLLSLNPICLHASAVDTAHDPIAAARANNTGVALMNQQLMEKALAKFEEAHKIDSTAAVPILNQG